MEQKWFDERVQNAAQIFQYLSTDGYSWFSSSIVLHGVYSVISCISIVPRAERASQDFTIKGYYADAKDVFTKRQETSSTPQLRIEWNMNYSDHLDRRVNALMRVVSFLMLVSCSLRIEFSWICIMHIPPIRQTSGVHITLTSDGQFWCESNHKCKFRKSWHCLVITARQCVSIYKEYYAKLLGTASFSQLRIECNMKLFLFIRQTGYCTTSSIDPVTKVIVSSQIFASTLTVRPTEEFFLCGGGLCIHMCGWQFHYGESAKGVKRKKRILAHSESISSRIC